MMALQLGAAVKGMQNLKAAVAAVSAFALNLGSVVWGSTALSDMLLCCTLSCSIFSFFWAYCLAPSPHDSKPVSLTFPTSSTLLYLLSSLTIALAVLTKGPIGAVLPIAVCASFLLYVGDLHLLVRFGHRSSIPVLPAAFLAFAAAAPWFLAMWLRHGKMYISTFFGYHNLERFTRGVNHHGGRPFWFSSMAVMVMFFPWSLSLPAAVSLVQPWSQSQRARWRRSARKERLPLLALIWALISFSVFALSKSQLPSYYLPMAPPVALLSASVLIDRGVSERCGGEDENAVEGEKEGRAESGGAEVETIVLADSNTKLIGLEASHSKMAMAGNNDREVEKLDGEGESEGAENARRGRSQEEQTKSRAHVELEEEGEAKETEERQRKEGWQYGHLISIATRIAYLMLALLFAVLPLILATAADKKAALIGRMTAARGLHLLPLLIFGGAALILYWTRPCSRENRQGEGKGGGGQEHGQPEEQGFFAQIPLLGPLVGRISAGIQDCSLWAVQACSMALFFALFFRPVYQICDRVLQSEVREMAVSAGKRQLTRGGALIMVGVRMPSVVFYASCPVAFFEDENIAARTLIKAHAREKRKLERVMAIVEHDKLKALPGKHIVLMERDCYKLVQIELGE